MVKQKIVACDYRRYEALLKGLTPILWNRPLTPEETRDAPTGVEKRAQWDRDNFRLRIHWDDKHGLYHRAFGARKMIELGLRKWDKNDIGGKKGTYSKKTEMGLKCHPFMVLDIKGNKIEKDSDLIEPYGDYVRNSSKNLVYSCRPKVNEWTARLIIEVIDPLIKENVVEAGLMLGGIYNGMGDYRTEYGKFDLVSLKEVTNGDSAR